MLAVFAHLVATLFMHPTSLAAPSDTALAGVPAGASGSTSEQLFAICSADGTRWVTIDGRSVPQPVRADHSEICSFCLPLTSGAVAAPQSLGTLDYDPAVIRVAFAPEERESAVAGRFNPSARPRAPPAMG